MKAAIYIEVKGKKEAEGKIFPWAGYTYADKEVDPSEYTFVKDSFDQWDKPVKVYQAKQKAHFEFPGGLEKTDKVVLF